MLLELVKNMLGYEAQDALTGEEKKHVATIIGSKVDGYKNGLPKLEVEPRESKNFPGLELRKSGGRKTLKE